MRCIAQPFKFLLFGIMPLLLLAFSSIPGGTQDTQDTTGKERIVAVILLDGYPTHFYDYKTGKASGFAVDVMEAVARRAGLEISYIYGQSFTELLNKVASGEADIAPSLGIDAYRNKMLDFTRPLDSSPLLLYVRAKDTSAKGLTGGIKVGVVRGSVSHEILRDRKDIQLKLYAGFSTGLFDLLAGEVDGFAASEATIMGLARKAGVEWMIKPVGPPHGEIRRAMAVRNGNSRLLGKLNREIEGFVGSPEYRRIFTKWYGRPVPYWTRRKITILGTALLFFSISVMVVWRYRSLLKLNRELVRNISERKRAEDALRAAEKRFRDLLETVRLVAVMLDRSGNIIFCNDHLLSLTGWTRDEVLDKSWFDLFLPEDVKGSVRYIFDSVVSGGALPLHYENAIVARDGSRLLIVWNNSVLRDSEGNIVGIASIGPDVTEHRKLEEQLRQSQKMEAMGLLAGGIAHDFNNMLQAIIGYGSLLKWQVKDEGKQGEYIRQMLNTVDRAAELTKGLLAYSRRQTLKLMTENLNEIVAEVQKLLLRIIGEDIELAITLCPAGPAALVDASQIRQVLINLAANARDAMPKGGKLTISTDIAETDEHFIKAHGHGEMGRYVLLRVTDTGTGMDTETRRRIFEPFFTTKETGKGTGLGLAIVYGIVKQHNGYIFCDSEPGKGTAFSVYLPLIEGKQERQSAAEIYSAPKGTETILLAEDDKAVRRATRVFLSDAGYEVIEAADGEDAVEKFKAHRDEIRLLLLDVIMPKKNGREAYEEIRQLSPGIKACFLSGYASDVIQSRAFPDETFQFIPKPVRPEELLMKIREFLDT